MSNKEKIEEIYNNTKWYYLVPLIGFIKYMMDVTKYTKGSPVHKKGTNEYKIMGEFTKKFFFVLNIFTPIYFLFNIFVFNIGLYIWKKPVKQAGYNIK